MIWLRWASWNAAVYWTMWMAVRGNVGAGRVVVLFTVLFFLYAVAALKNESANLRKFLRDHKSLPLWARKIDASLDFFAGLGLLWNGFVVCGVVIAISALGIEAALARIEKEESCPAG